MRRMCKKPWAEGLVVRAGLVKAYIMKNVKSEDRTTSGSLCKE